MTTQRKHIGNEQFFTQLETVRHLTAKIKEQSWFTDVTRVLEPSAGDGVWLDEFPGALAFDIEPQHPDVVQADYLKLDLDYQKGTLVVGNPPFGRMGTLAVEFFNRASSQADFIAFILPASFGKRTLQRRLDKNFHLSFQQLLLDESFRLGDAASAEGAKKQVKCVFQIWERSDHPREDSVPNRKHPHWDWVRDPKDGDLAIRTHGHGYGKITEVTDERFLNLNRNTHRFMKSNIPRQELRDRLRSLPYQSAGELTVGQSCVSKEEIVRLYESKVK